jgi:hypothetical protein
VSGVKGRQTVIKSRMRVREASTRHRLQAFIIQFLVIPPVHTQWCMRRTNEERDRTAVSAPAHLGWRGARCRHHAVQQIARKVEEAINSRVAQPPRLRQLRFFGTFAAGH